MSEPGRIAVLDDDRDLADALMRLLAWRGHEVRSFSDPQDLLAALADFAPDCLLCDIRIGSADGFAVSRSARALQPAMAVVFMTAWPVTTDAVDAVRKFGGVDYLEKPLDEDRLMAAIEEALSWSRVRRAAVTRLEPLSRREREVFDLLVLGHPNKTVADRLGISIKTVEDHRAAIMAKTSANGLAQLIDLGRALTGAAIEG
ncbi:response regulator receiver [Novosphingobium nitrogenifigens DSM 19370]|uniref:Response regulator receiver n=1 Tax=Novosphingobium nitrogenifigens DSM 19370 TaxID=983920 RepID=F1Z4R0_9SPHN|nr:response regulator receiver [Novosphingobium nitrogenifigens DSM 19370]